MSTLIPLVIVLGLIFIVPILCRKVHIPVIIGFILVGVGLGPCGLSILSDSPAIQAFGQLGILYIMFQAGVEIDINDFRPQRGKAIVFGLLTFLLPVALGYVTSLLLGMQPIVGLLLGAMYGSHTLMTYPIVRRYGLQKNVATNITVGGTMIALALSLFVLAGVQVYMGTEHIDLPSLGIWIVKVVGVIAVILAFFPWVVKVCFKFRWEPTVNFILVIFVMVLSALLCQWAGLSSVLGAFLCGVALNRLIPNLSQLMNQITFVGNSMFVPIFLIEIGLMMNLRMVGSWGWLAVVAAVMIVTKLAGKWLAAALTQGLFRLQLNERQLIFGLSHATAAGTLAIVAIGYQMGLFDDTILNGAIVMILVLCTTASFVTEYAAKRLSLQEDARLESERILDDWLMGSVGEDLHNELKELSNLSSLHETEIVECADWKEMETLVEHTSKSIAIYHEQQPLNTINRMLIAVPPYAEKEHDFISCFGQLRRLSSQIGAKVVFYATEQTQSILRALCHRQGKYLKAGYRTIVEWQDVRMMIQDLEQDDMLVIISSRQSTPSYNPLFTRIPDLLTRQAKTHSTMLIYPEQIIGGDIPDRLLMDIPQASSTWRIVTKIKQSVYELFTIISQALRPKRRQ